MRPDEGVDVEIHLEKEEGDQGAEAGRGEAGENRQRVDVALIQNAEDDVDDQNGDDQQDEHVAEGTLEGFGRALEGGADGGGQSLVGNPDLLYLPSSEAPCFRLNGDSDGLELSEVIDGLGAAELDLSEGIERDQLCSWCGLK